MSVKPTLSIKPSEPLPSPTAARKKQALAAARSIIDGSKQTSGLFGDHSTGNVGDFLEVVDDTQTSFADIIGHERAIAQFRRLTLLFLDRESREAVGAGLPKGILLTGAPGVGKTFLVRALANEANAILVSLSCSRMKTLWFGESEKNLEKVFQAIRNIQKRIGMPVILFVDELDEIFQKRDQTAHRADQAMTNALLRNLDGISKDDSTGIILIGATNNPQNLDDAVRRAGRLDKEIKLSAPDKEARKKLFELYLKKAQTKAKETLVTDASQIISDDLLEKTEGFSGADIAEIVKRAIDLKFDERITSGKVSPISAADLIDIVEAYEHSTIIDLHSKGLFEVFNSKRKLNDVFGQPLAVEKLREFVGEIKDRERLLAVVLQPSKGVLLVGPPGTGKTLIAEAVAGETKSIFLVVNSENILSGPLGSTEKNVTHIFHTAADIAKEQGVPVIIFFDEIDRILANPQTQQPFLTCLDGILTKGHNTNVFVMGATNKPEQIDAALIRPGRFDLKVEVGLPSVKGREEHLRRRVAYFRENSQIPITAENIDFERLAKLTAGMSGAGLDNLTQMAIKKSLSHSPTDSVILTQEDFEKSLEHILGLTAEAAEVRPQDRKIISIHEAGHALVAHQLGEKVDRLTSLPKMNGTGGLTSLEPEKVDFASYTEDDFRKMIKALLAGYAAEKIGLRSVSLNAQDDLRRARQIAAAMVVKYGMAGVELTSDEKKLTLEQKRAIQKILKECMAEVEQILNEKKDLLTKIGDALLEKGELNAEEFAELVVENEPSD